MRIVFDVDDTISTNHRKLSYDKCIPNKSVIRKINYLHDALGYQIVLHTSRGMISCEGDLDRIIAKNKKTLEDWLEKNDVHYDEIIFGKPIADLYVDDKAMSLDEFKTAEFGLLHGGGSKKEIHRMGKIVKKDLGNAADTERFKDWIEDCYHVCKYPQIISYLYDTVYMSYIDGPRLVDRFFRLDLTELLGIISKFKAMPAREFSLKPQIDILEKNRTEDREMNRYIDIAESFLNRHAEEIERHASFCHGDLTLGNVIKGRDGLYLIDPRYFRESSTYLFDLAKLRMSLNDYEKLFGLSSASNEKYLGEFDQIMKESGLYPLIVGLNLMFVCRLYRYKTPDQKFIVKDMAWRIVSSNEELFGTDTHLV